MSERNLTLKDVDMNEVYKDLNKVMYMLHHLDGEAFTKEEIRNVAFSLNVMVNSIEEMMKGK
jgi:hypothetical protein